MNIKKMSDEDLIQTNKELFDMINNVECYGVRDVELENATAIELIKRGYKNQTYKTVDWEKEE
jgi:hypothetical protein